ncbi:MAG: Ig domain-containing protein [Candidatus Scatosoma sp.]
MKKRFVSVLVTLLCVMFGAFGLSACEGGKVAVESVTLNKTELTLEIGGEETLTATVTPDNATEKTVAWSSDNTDVATVANGKVTAVAAGTATVTATADGKSATCSVTVNVPAPKTEVTAEQWAQIMESVDNFTFTNFNDEYSVTGKIDGTTVSAGETSGRREQIFVAEGEKYYLYDNGDGSWKKSSITEQDYHSYAGDVTVVAALFKDDFADFDYVEGKYVAETLEKTSGTYRGVFRNVEITFENGALISINFIHVDSTYVNIYNVGTTVITLPAEYTDNTGSSQNG